VTTEPTSEATPEPLPQRLRYLFGASLHVKWDALSAEDRAYWEQQADAVRRAVAGAEQQPTPGAQACPHESWAVTGEHREDDGWHKSRRCNDCAEDLPPVVEAEPHWDIKPYPAVGQQWVHLTEPGRVVTITDVWPAGDDGHTAVAYEWRDRGQCGSACPLGVFLGTYEPYAEPAEQPPAEDIAQNIRDAITYSSDTASPALATVRDLILTLPGSTPASALASARVILAAHTRELATAQHTEARTVGADMRARSDRSRVAHCGGRHAVIANLRRYADALDAAAVDGEL
jgi:hypothetical protein